MNAVIAALYVVLTMPFGVISTSAGLQFRPAEALTILPSLMPYVTPGLAIGCAISNMVSAFGIADVVFGSLATLIGALGTYALRRRPYLSLIPPILANTVIVPFVLVLGYGLPFTVPSVLLSALTVCIGEVLSCGVLGVFLMKIVKKYLPNLNEMG